MFRFETKEHLYALILLPILLVFFWLMWVMKKKALEKFGNPVLIKKLMPEVSRYKDWLKFSLLLLATAFLVIAWANPQWGSKREKVKRKSSDVFIALDISLSMMGTDIAPNRMERAKQFSQKLIQALRGERLGTIIFAGNAYLQVPLTTDYAAAQMFVRSANPNMAPTQGTAISEAIDLAEQSFSEDNKHNKALIIITDGEDHDEVALERARAARANGLAIFTIGVGTQEGSYIPDVIGGRQDFKRDKNGQTVRSKLNEDILKQLASVGSGSYFNLATNKEIVAEIKSQIDKMEKQEFEQRSFSEFESYFQYFLFPAILLLIIEFLLSFRRSKWLANKDIFKA